MLVSFTNHKLIAQKQKKKMSYERVSFNGYGYEDPTNNHGGWQRQNTPDDYYFQISRTERMPTTVIDAPVTNFNDLFKREVYVTRHEENAPVYPNPQSSLNDPFRREVHVTQREEHAPVYLPNPQSSLNDPFRREVHVTRREEHAPVYLPNPQSSLNDPFRREVHVTRREEHAPVYLPNLQSSFNDPFKREVYVTRHEEHAPVYPNIHSISNNTREGHVTRHKEHVPKAQEKVHVKKHVHFEQAKDGKNKSCDGNVDAEAEDFIKLKHKKFEQSRLMSMKGY